MINWRKLLAYIILLPLIILVSPLIILYALGAIFEWAIQEIDP